MSLFNKKTDITFKKVTVNDVAEWLRIESTVDSKMYSKFSDEQEAIKEIENNEVYFIIKDNKNIGSLEYQIQDSGHAYLSGLIVVPEFQGQGIARKAVEFRLDKLKDMKRIDLVTHPHNSKVITLYLSLGFHIESWKDNYFGDGEPRIVLAKEK
ncbi:MAG: GNAT family N-acetyltransferase [Nanoarchaeota archaeon]|nr:GNAT family N-acetyltransferase [Nanoarchaeota archaeon]